MAQDYKALNGSAFAGSLAVTNNPAAIVRLPYSWDFTPLGLQVKYSTNAILLKRASYLTKWKNADVEARLNNGRFRRNAFIQSDIRLFNTRIRLNENSALALGISGREYLSLATSLVNGQDSLGSLREFIGINQNHLPVSGKGRGIAWMEYFGTYARTVKFINEAQLNLGITVSLNRGLAGGFIHAENFTASPGRVNNQPGYYLSDGLLSYGYSNNLDGLDTVENFQSGWRNFFNSTQLSASLSIGAEYFIPGSYDDPSDYDFKIGLSVMDIGKNKFRFSNFSRIARFNQPAVSDSLIEQKFTEIFDAASLADSLQSIAGTINPLTGYFALRLPTRFILSTDKRLAEHFFIHADVSLPLPALAGKKKLVVQDMNLATLALRYENERFGFYLPVSLNRPMNLWMGGAVRAGPLWMGVHNWANLISKNRIHKGGMYLALIFRFRNKEAESNEKGCDTNGINTSAFRTRLLKRLSCPTHIH